MDHFTPYLVSTTDNAIELQWEPKKLRKQKMLNQGLALMFVVCGIVYLFVFDGAGFPALFYLLPIMCVGIAYLFLRNKILTHTSFYKDKAVVVSQRILGPAETQEFKWKDVKQILLLKRSGKGGGAWFYFETTDGKKHQFLFFSLWRFNQDMLEKVSADLKSWTGKKVAEYK